MEALRWFVVAVVAFVVLAVPSVVLADGRGALVVGNSTYPTSGGRRTWTTRPATAPRRCGGWDSR